MIQNPFVYETMINSLGQTIDFVEHPTRGDEAQVICVSHELKLASYSTFYEVGDMVRDDKEYEPSFKDGKFLIGGFE